MDFWRKYLKFVKELYFFKNKDSLFIILIKNLNNYIH